MKGHVFEEYGSETYRSRPPDPNMKDLSGGGRGYLRNISLLSLWAHSPFMHNNAIGPEICGNPVHKEDDFYRSPYVDDQGIPLPPAKAPKCWQYDPSVEGRFALFKASMQQLLNPKERGRKISTLDKPIRIPVGPRVWSSDKDADLSGLAIALPAGTPADFWGNLQHKELFDDVVLSQVNKDKLKTKMQSRFGQEKGEIIAKQVIELGNQLVAHPKDFLAIGKEQLPLLKQVYMSCTTDVENDGHRFGEALSPADKKALTAFLATL
jgi:hypothetical protein